MSYKHNQTLPKKLSDFYDTLFQALLQRHDGTKPGFTRNRKCKIDDTECRKIFECICILTKDNSVMPLTHDGIIHIAKKSLEANHSNAKATAYLDDIVKVTCLLVKDGEEYRYIHKTVQEYYAASYVRSKPDSWAQIFYTRMRVNHTAHSWTQELEFLSEIDSFRYNSYFYIPGICSLFKTTEDGIRSINEHFSPEQTFALAKLTRIKFTFCDDDINSIQWQTQSANAHPAIARLSTSLMHALIESCAMEGIYRMFSSTPVHKLPLAKDYESYEFHEQATKTNKRIYRETELRSITDYDIAKDQQLIINTVQKVYGAELRKAKEILKTIKEQESTSVLEGLF